MEALVEYNYEAQEPDELTIRKGDVIKDIKVSNGGWWEGTLKDKRGMFPDNFVKVLEPARSGSRNSGERTSDHEEVTLRNGPGRRFCKVLFSYEPCNDDELKLIPEESVEYLGEVEEGWWRGCSKGRIGVFPSNFVSPPSPEESDRNLDKKEYCRVLYPYEAANEDELTIVEGDVITLLSRDAPDKGWWKGELKGQVGLFPDNFVEVLAFFRPETNRSTTTTDSIPKLQPGKKKEAGIRKSLDNRNLSNAVAKKITSSSSVSSLTGSLTEKKTNPLISGLRRLVSETSTSNGNGNGNAGAGLVGEELDEVEREGSRLEHLTATRAKAPRRRLPTAQHLRHHTSPPASAGPLTSNNNFQIEENITNGSSETAEPTVKNDENDGLIAKARRKAPWVEELKLNQMERKKLVTDRAEKGDTKKDRVTGLATGNSVDSALKLYIDSDDTKSKEKEKEKSPRRLEPPTPVSDHSISSPVSNTPAFVPYHVYNQLLDRFAALEEKCAVLERLVDQHSAQIALVINSSAEKD